MSLGLYTADIMNFGLVVRPLFAYYNNFSLILWTSDLGICGSGYLIIIIVDPLKF